MALYDNQMKRTATIPLDEYESLKGFEKELNELKESGRALYVETKTYYGFERKTIVNQTEADNAIIDHSNIIDENNIRLYANLSQKELEVIDLQLKLAFYEAFKNKWWYKLFFKQQKP